ncbi:MAG: hypothetical protein CUN51_07040 [Candidatus Thermofonsia Clade 1 bacterium]|uniref:Glycoside hydrolase family 5 domain-containing protein n=1 Tax=Candidatus Thermofonsia Clade 1 bacterium TaxID=2364210 RepID=A0A2M8NZN1_9CHLR|nr:MAG: hypothetical protein CUN51_07040 [Candidatus Thermofonsia Clade 1 bacterium]
MMIKHRVLTPFALLFLLSLLIAACSREPSERAPTEAPHYQKTATHATPIHTPIIGQLGAVDDPSATPILIQQATPSPTKRLAQLSTPAFTATFGAVVDGSPAPMTHTPTVLPPTLPLGTPTATLPFGAVVDPNYTPPPTYTPMPSPTFPSGTLPPPATLPPADGTLLRADLMGVQIHTFLNDDDFSVMLDRTAELGVGWVKFQLSWKLYEPAQGQFSSFYYAMVLNVQRASLRGFKTLISVAKAPDWARPPAVHGIEDGPPADPQHLADFIAAFVRDVKPEFIDAIEVWNEPNLIREWRGNVISGADYMRYFRAAYEAILREQRAQPSALKPTHRIMVITAGPAPTVTLPDGSTMGDREWLQDLYNNGLATLSADGDIGIGVHSFGWANPPEARCCQATSGVTGWYEHPSFYFRETLDAYRQIMLRNGHGNARLWVTEFGWATYDGLKRSDGTAASADSRYAWQTFLNQEQQAAYILRAFRLAQSAPYNEFVGPMIVWNLNFAMIPELVDNSREEAGFSLLDSQGRPRPAFHALRDTPKRR